MSSPYSPARKRQRLSSPLYEGTIDSLSQEDLAAFDALEAKFLQSVSNSSQPLDGNCDGRITPDKSSLAGNLVDDIENPFTSTSGLPGFAPASSRRVGQKASIMESFDDDIHQSNCPSSYDTLFKPASNLPFLGFQAASAAGGSVAGPSTGFGPANMGFTTASKKSIYAPSKAALAAAQAKIEAIWNGEEQQSNPEPSAQTFPDVFVSAGSSTSHKRLALQALENTDNSPRTPLHAGTNLGDLAARPFPPLVGRSIDKGKGKAGESGRAESIHEQSDPKNIHLSTPTLTRSRQFVSPLVAPQAHRSTAKENDPIPSPQNKFNLAFTSAASQLPAAQRSFTPRRVVPTAGPSPTLEHPHSTGGIRKKTFKSVNRPFVTPLKATPKHNYVERVSPHKDSLSGSTPGPGDSRKRALGVLSPRGKDKYPHFFDLTPPLDRITLKSSGLLLQRFEAEGLDTSLLELTQILPSLTLYYSFHSASNNINSQTPNERLGSSAALHELERRGCALATRPWVDNHWCLILWKLAGMALLNPDQEKDPTKKKWCWSEVMRQLLYRYERELNRGKRPALRLITARDAPAALPMILCVSDIFWSESEHAGDSNRVPVLEMSDGWYRLRATVDPPLARAIGRGIIRIGRKIGIASARLSSEKKEPSEVLDAYNNTKLLLSGNSSHLMPWHAKLGFQQGPFISTLHSLTADGGCAAVLDVVVTKAFPIAYIEFFEGDGQKRREGPRTEDEEAKLHDQWKRRREQEASKLRNELDKRFSLFETYINRLTRRAGTTILKDNESPPDNIDELYDLLEDTTEANTTIARLDPVEASWLAKHIRASLDKERETAGEAIERDLQKICPLRDIRNFRVVAVQDACTRRRPANRIAQITVWDVLALSFDEGDSKGAFVVGQRYLVTNLIPAQQSSWMNYDPGSQIFLSTRRDSRWTRLR